MKLQRRILAAALLASAAFAVVPAQADQKQAVNFHKLFTAESGG